MKLRLKGALLLTAAFLLGMAAGAFGLAAVHSHWGWPSPAGGPLAPHIVLGHLDRELGLTAAQREQLEAILRETREEFARLREEVRPRFRDIRTRSRARIREVLEPAQREKFDALVAWRDERMRRRSDGPSGSPWAR